MANDDPPSTPPGPSGDDPEGRRPGNGGPRAGGSRRGRGARGEPQPRKPRLPQRDVAEDEPPEGEGAPNGAPAVQFHDVPTITPSSGVPAVLGTVAPGVSFIAQRATRFGVGTVI